jgi:hypothetical protein
MCSPTQKIFGFLSLRFLVMAFPRTAILILKARGIASFACLHVIEKLQVHVSAAILQLGESVPIHFVLEIRSSLESFESPDSFIDSLVHQVQRFKQMCFPHGKSLSAAEWPRVPAVNRDSGSRLLAALRRGLLLPFLLFLDAFLFVGYG